MDKETLSNYGWIVICVLVLAVMIALASPFGTYISDAVKSTTEGLFNTSENALNIVGMTAGNGKFDSSENDIQFVKSKNLFTQKEMETGRLVNGVVDESLTAYVTLGYSLDISEYVGKYICLCDSKGNTGSNALAFYDSDKNYLSGNNYSNNDGGMIIPEGAVYFRASIGKGGSAGTFGYFVYETDYSDVIYEPYFEPYQKTWYTNLKATALGDSITANGNLYTTEDGRTGSGWRITVAKELHLANEQIYNCGIGGSKVSGDKEDAMWTDERINAIPTDTEILFFNGGMNDWGAKVDFGDEDSTDTNTFYGALNTIATKIKARVPNAVVFFMGTTYGEINGSSTNSKGHSQLDYSNCIKKVAEKNGFVFIDLYNQCGWNHENVATYVNTEGTNNIHPNKTGGETMTKVIVESLKSYKTK